jgi:hypothetical protein
MKCRCCGSSDLERVLDLGAQPWGNDFIPISENRVSERYPLELFFCRQCAMVQIGHTVPKETMFSDHNYMSGTTRSLALHFEGVATRILSRTAIGPNEYILDIGGNDGTFLRSFSKRGTKVLNVDSGRKQTERSSANGVECLNEFFNEQSAIRIESARGKAKVIHGSGIFFHLEELHSVFKGVNRLLDNDGLLVAEFIYLPEMIKNCAFDQIYHEHLLYYGLTTFSRFLNIHGLEIHDCVFAPIHGGSCVAFIGHKGSRPQSAAVLSNIACEATEGFLTTPIYHEFAHRVEKLRSDLRGAIADLRGKGKSVQTLGAPVKGSTIINYCGFSEKDIDCATEINELKCNTYVPGTRIPVVHQFTILPPDVYLLLSWNFKDEILAHLKEFRANGGKILVPIPSPHLL